MMESLAIRCAQPGDEHVLMQMIRELAEFERLADQVQATPALLATTLFSEAPTAEAVLADWQGRPAGFALFFTSFSTFVGRPGLYLEDLYVRENLRGQGIGKAMLLHLAGLARKRHYGRMEWSVLDWNRSAIDFYQSLGAKPMDDWTVFRLDEGALARLGGGDLAV